MYVLMDTFFYSNETLLCNVNSDLMALKISGNQLHDLCHHIYV